MYADALISYRQIGFPASSTSPVGNLATIPSADRSSREPMSIPRPMASASFQSERAPLQLSQAVMSKARVDADTIRFPWKRMN